ncbi:peptidylprolyl isomerase [Tenacibaculum geojense]|uniref:Peptidylprolyl isomerase n=1 Tax=Tenacibaculum geojense TaxID=915352 RepID=A0ABW3JR36_9FLAO
MKHYIGILLILFTIIAKGQTKKEIKQTLESIKSQEDFKKYKSQNSDSIIEFIELNTLNSGISKKLLGLKKGEIKKIKIENGNYYYKLIDSSKETEYRASYIYLNADELTKKEIDSIRPIIIKKYKSGVLFTDLVDEYNMDGNSKKGDLGWFKKGKLVPDFEKAVIEHNESDIFTVDVDNSDKYWMQNWYYVVLKTHKDRISEIRTYIRIKKQ